MHVPAFLRLWARQTGSRLCLSLLCLGLLSCGGNGRDGENGMGADSPRVSLDTLQPDTALQEFVMPDATATAQDWTGIDPSAPAATFQEIQAQGVLVTGSGRYTVYRLDEGLLFDKQSPALRKGAEKALGEVAASLEQRFPKGAVRVQTITDTTGNADRNRELAAARAAAVKDWLEKNGKIAAERLTSMPASPAASSQSKLMPQRAVMILVQSTNEDEGRKGREMIGKARVHL